MSGRGKYLGAVIRVLLWMIPCFFIAGESSAQQIYTIKNGKMYVELGKKLDDRELEDFITRFHLKDLALKKLIREGFRDSAELAGWEIVVNNGSVVTLTKSLVSADDMRDPVARLLLTGEDFSYDVQYPAISNQVKYGFNKFRDKPQFAVSDSMVTFYLKGHREAREVMLTGSFNDWQPDRLKMQKVDSGWIYDMKLTPGKYWYKFIVDGLWQVDQDNRLSENDGKGNTNSVFFMPNTFFRLKGHLQAKRVILSGSFNEWKEKEIEMHRGADGWTVPVYLAEGTHTYRFIVDKNWMEDPGNSEKLPNEFGEYNSKIAIGKPHTFSLPGYHEAKRVSLAGSFNGWKQQELWMSRTAGGWELPYVLGPGNYAYRFFVDGRPAGDQLTLVLQPNYTFQLAGFDNARAVFLAGDFNNWDPGSLPMKRENGKWVLPVHLSRGKHLYKFIIDGKWLIDPVNPLWEQNEHQTGNSVLWIEQ
jgi:hypothetical protein